ncbi:MAG TPA: hypothetical protein VFS66_02890 [Acidimicrobiia bacterium]|nr:hypothetical protein [Acidimicrobiia bacterium]
MPVTDMTPDVRDQWLRLATYRQRYQIEDRLGTIHSLEKSLARRQSRRSALSRRIAELEQALDEALREMKAVDAEIAGGRVAGALLIAQVLDQVIEEMGEAWSPAPVRGFRVWRIADNKVKGNQVHWPTRTLSSVCLRQLPGEDLPHPMSRCGPPACGIYAVKDLDKFPRDVGDGMMDRSMLGVVGLTGKVIEHSDGYRGQHGTVMAMSVNHWNRWLMTCDARLIEEFFNNPRDVMFDAGDKTKPDPTEVRPFLEAKRDEERSWT